MNLGNSLAFFINQGPVFWAASASVAVGGALLIVSIFVFFRMGDDLGFKTSPLLAPATIRTHLVPQYKRVVDLIHGNGKKFLLHSCGNIFDIMEDLK